MTMYDDGFPYNTEICSSRTSQARSVTFGFGGPYAVTTSSITAALNFYSPGPKPDACLVCGEMAVKSGIL